MNQPGKKKVNALMSSYVQRGERWLNAHISRASPRAVVGSLVAFSLVMALTVASCLYFIDARISGVGSISSPTVLRAADKALNGQTPLETLYQLQRKQAFLDSVEQLGIERMEEIYSEKFKTQGHD